MQGTPGKPGQQGPMGPMGPQGHEGHFGEKGRRGAEGSQGPVGPRGDRVSFYIHVVCYVFVVLCLKDRERQKERHIMVANIIDNNNKSVLLNVFKNNERGEGEQ